MRDDGTSERRRKRIELDELETGGPLADDRVEGLFVRDASERGRETRVDGERKLLHHCGESAKYRFAGCRHGDVAAA